jgi:hypothetical protein
MDVVWVLFGSLAAVHVYQCLVPRYRDPNRALALRAGRVSRRAIADARDGDEVRIVGVVESAQPALTAPMTDQPCLAYQTLVDPESDFGWLYRAVTDEGANHLTVRDPTGTVRVAATAAQLALALTERRSFDRWTRAPYVEDYLRIHRASRTVPGVLGVRFKWTLIRQGALRTGDQIAVSGVARWARRGRERAVCSSAEAGGKLAAMRLRRPHLVFALMLLLFCSIARAEDPPAIRVPAGVELALALKAKGAQVYVCQAKGAVFEWTLKQPDAKLFDPSGNVLGSHYAGPTWELKDGSKIVGEKVASANGAAGAIPWLLLKVKSAEGRGALSPIAYVQRVDTSGGAAPRDVCDAAHVATERRVDYAATYRFYAQRR